MKKIWKNSLKLISLTLLLIVFISVSTFALTASYFLFDSNDSTMKLDSIKIVKANTPGNDYAGIVQRIENLQSMLENVPELYPVGSIYIASNSTNPSTYFGGTWVAFGTGRTLVGIDTSDTSFDTVEETGGEKTHQLTTSEIPAHTHGSKSLTGSFQVRRFGTSGTGINIAMGTGGIISKEIVTWSGNHCLVGVNLVSTSTSQYETVWFTGTHEHSSVGSNTAHNNLEPYITVYMWKRTA